MDEEARLIVVLNEKDADGFAIEEEQEITIYVREKSAVRTEFYEALRAGISVKTILEARQEDWELSAHIVEGKKQYATQIEYDGSLYDVVRTYKNDKSMIEIVCS